MGQMLSTQKERIDLNTDVDNAPALLTAVDAHIHTIETLSDAELIRNNRVLLRSTWMKSTCLLGCLASVISEACF